MKVAELTGAQLDYWVAKAGPMPVYEAGSDTWPGNGKVNAERFEHPIVTVGLMRDLHIEDSCGGKVYAPSSNWAQGGPIIERERIKLLPVDGPGTYMGDPVDGPRWLAKHPNCFGNEMAVECLTAAMRAFVVSKFGDDVEVI